MLPSSTVLKVLTVTTDELLTIVINLDCITKSFYEFGEGVEYRRRGQSKFDTRFARGVYLGCRLVDEQHLVADSSTGEVVTCRDVKQRPKEMRFSFTEFDAAIKSCSFVGSPPRSSMTKQFAEVAFTQREEIVPKYKSFQCKETYFMEYGFTPGCAGCR
jgi:hypothetical protein